MVNIIETKSIVELREPENRKLFYIPAYQRGYRWNEEQVEDLLDDLYSFAMKKNKEPGEFYCLQPVIVKEINDEKRLMLTNEKLDLSEFKEKYEVIDGQQRLTTLYIIISYLIDKFGDDEESKQDEMSGLYKLVFETRPKMFNFLEDLKNNVENKTPEDIDEKHVITTYNYINTWLNNKKSVSKSKGDIARDLAKLLRQGKDTDESCGCVQIIWYELSEEKNEIREFLSTNNGKIQLTESELVKAIFLQKRNFVNDSKNLKQMEKALQWENIENTLHQDDFWYFINSDKNLYKSNRIEYILKLALLDNKNENNTTINKIEKNVLFRDYYNEIDGKEGEELENIINTRWNNIINIFRTIEDWYVDPIKYNYIGYLSHAGISINEIYSIFKNLPEDSSQEDFILKLKEKIKETLENIKVEENTITLDYEKTEDRKLIRKILLLLNIDTLNSQLENLRVKKNEDVNNKNKDESNLYVINYNENIVSPMYKFPFDIYINQEWDVEHIDSQTTNKLDKNEDKKKWVEGYANKFTSDEQFNRFFKESNYDECINIIKRTYEEDDEENKHCIGNLTLLDSQTNRSYGNDIFFRKQERILDEIKGGKYVPICTQMVFNKSFDINEMSLPKWNSNCKLKYGQYIYDKLRYYLGK